MTTQQRTTLFILTLIGLCLVYSTIIMAPLLLQLSAEFGISVGMAGLATAAFSVPVVLSVIAGPFSDRYGRKRFLVSGTALLGVSMLAAAAAPTFELLILFRSLGGIGAALCLSSLLPSISDTFPYRERGRAIAFLAGANAAATIFGIPLAGILAEATSWRASLGVVGVLASIASIVVALRLPVSKTDPAAPSVRGLYGLVLGHRSSLLLLAVGVLAGLPTSAWIAYVVVFLQTTFDLPQGLASVVALSGGIGYLLGSQAAGRVGDRVGHRGSLVAGLLVGAVLFVSIVGSQGSIVFAVALNVGLGAMYGMRVVSHTAILSEQLPVARATLISISNATGNAGAALGVSIGGMLIDVGSFSLLGLSAAALLMVALVPLALAAVPIEAEMEAEQVLSA